VNIDISENHTFPKRLRMFLSKDVSAGLDAKGRRELAASLSAYPVLAFHATRLLPHAEESIRVGGLVPLDEDFQIRRVAQAVGSGDLPPELGDRMLKGGRKLLRSQRSAREGRICFGVGRDILKTSAGGFSNLLRSWGGESLYGDLPVGSEDRAFVRTIGRPSMVVAQLDLTDEACMANYTHRQDSQR
jgi:hypothetical protein